MSVEQEFLAVGAGLVVVTLAIGKIGAAYYEWNMDEKLSRWRRRRH